jgi:hypothetical protein
MKTFFIITFLFCTSVLTDFGVSAKTTTTTYYGTKASSNTNNPCKGETTRVCGTVKVEENQVISPNGQVSLVTKKEVRDGEGTLLSKDEVTAKTNQTVIVLAD